MELITVVVLALAVLVAGTTVADAVGPAWGPATPKFNLEVILRPVAGAPDSGFGLVKFRQAKDAERMVYLGVWVRDLAADHSYNLQRATDSNGNDDYVG